MAAPELDTNVLEYTSDNGRANDQRASRQEDGISEKNTCSPSVNVKRVPSQHLHAWEADPRGYYQTFYNQFANLIMIATFTGGVQAAVLSLLNDVLSSEALNVQLFLPDPKNEGRTLYTVYSLGLMLGLLAVALNLTVAAIAAVNAALACHFSLHTPEYRPSMEARIVFCMIVQFIAFGLAGLSLILLIVKFDIAFTIITAILLFAGIAVSAYHLIALFGSHWFSKLRKHPLHAVSLIIATTAFVFEVALPSPSSWFTITNYGMTIIYHMLAVLHNKSPRSDRPRKLAFFGVIMLAAFWVGCAVVTYFLRHQSHWIVLVVCILSAVEAATLLLIGVVDGRRVWR